MIFIASCVNELILLNCDYLITMRYEKKSNQLTLERKYCGENFQN